MKTPDAGISTERLDELDADVLAIWDYAGESAKAQKDPRWAKLPAVASDSIIWADLVLASAANSPSPSSFDHLIDVVLPVLQKSSISK
ncbi:hypothetical protein [Aeromicrobium sp. UC242_57]|uniref:hypothetical protein n=1 Tax=Aeromicrobium sp. UC242_57 TaxID=3374624 RepID=UPI0037BCF470